MFQTVWIKGLADDTYTANVIDLTDRSLLDNLHLTNDAQSVRSATLVKPLSAGERRNRLAVFAPLGESL